MSLSDYAEVWHIDFEFRAPDGERPEIRCLVAKEYHSGRVFRMWADDLGPLPPFDTGSNSLVVAYYASAEMACFIRLGWRRPENLLDLYAEFRCRYNGIFLPAGSSLNGALTLYGFPPVTGKETGRELAMRPGPSSEYTKAERKALLDYCQTDVEGLGKLLPRMEHKIDFPRGLLRGRYMAGVAVMEWNGVPIDTVTLDRLRQHWGDIKASLVAEIDQEYGVFEGTTFKESRFEEWLAENGIAWPRLESGKLDLKGDTFRDVAKGEPRITPLKELRHALSELRINRLSVGGDGRNRCLLSPFGAKTSRNLPSNAKFIFGPSAWLRSLIKPQAGKGLAYIDFSQQEFAIAAVLSGDSAMQNAYLSGDPYLNFGKLAGVIPGDGTKASHPVERSLFKACVLGVQYGMGPESLARRIGMPVIKGRELILMHRETFPDFWKWSEAAVNYALTTRELHSALGWKIYLNGIVNGRALANWPIQTNGAEILRLSVILAIEAGIKVCCPIHDALMIESDLETLDEDIAKAQAAMQEAGGIVLDGFDLRTDVERVAYPDRYMDERGVKMWDKVMKLLDSQD